MVAVGLFASCHQALAMPTFCCRHDCNLTCATQCRYNRVSEADHVHRDIEVLEADEIAWEVKK